MTGKIDVTGDENFIMDLYFSRSLEYGPLFLFWGVHVPILIVCDPADVKVSTCSSYLL